MLRRSASDAGRKGDPADGGGVGQAGPPAEAGEACRLPPSRGRDPFVMILFGVDAVVVFGDQDCWLLTRGDEGDRTCGRARAVGEAVLNPGSLRCEI